MPEKTREELLDAIEKKGFYYEAHHHDCCQCALLALMELFELRGDSVFKAATPFAGGVGRTGQICGAISGAVMVFGLLWGRDMETMMIPDEDERLEKLEASEQKTTPLIKKLEAKYLEEYGTFHCDGIQTKLFGRPYSSGTDKDREEMDEMGGHEHLCPSVVGKAARWAAEIIMDEREKDKAEQNQWA